MQTKQTERKVKADFHNHLIYDREIQLADIPLFIETAHRRLGSGGIVGLVDYYGETTERNIQKN